MRKTLTAVLVTIALSLTMCFAANEAPKSNLPKVLIIGDSISIGYTPYVSKILKDEAEVIHNKGNAENTSNGLLKIDQWLGTQKWDVIHFNWGLWDICYRHPESKEKGKRDKIKGTQMTAPDQYEKNLEELVTRLAKTGAKLIWGSTSLVPENEVGRFVGDEVKYNEIAARIMSRHKIPVNDLYADTKGFDPALFIAPGDVHYKEDGSMKLAAQVSEAILKALNEGLSATNKAAETPEKR